MKIPFGRNMTFAVFTPLEDESPIPRGFLSETGLLEVLFIKIRSLPTGKAARIGVKNELVR